jgi:hypothetical protein
MAHYPDFFPVTIGGYTQIAANQILESYKNLEFWLNGQK